MKYAIIDFRMRSVEKEFIKSLGYELIENNFNLDVYDEISAHVDIYYLKVGRVLFAAPERADKLPFAATTCVTHVGGKYPLDVPYNVCIVGNNAVHNFKYTDEVIKTYLINSGYRLIDVGQGYARCSTFPVDDNSCITSDIGVARALMDAGIEVLYVSEPDVKLKTRTNKIFEKQSQMSFMDSTMEGFIGGAMARFGDTVVLFGDVNNLINANKIKSFIEKKGLKFHHFEGLDVVDYGGVVEVNI